MTAVYKQGSSGCSRPRHTGSWSPLFPSLYYKAYTISLIVIMGVLVVVHCLRAWWASIWNRNKESQDGNKEFKNPGRRGRRRPMEACLRALKSPKSLRHQSLRGESFCRLSWKFFADFGVNNYTNFQHFIKQKGTAHYRNNMVLYRQRSQPLHMKSQIIESRLG